MSRSPKLSRRAFIATATTTTSALIASCGGSSSETLGQRPAASVKGQFLTPSEMQTLEAVVDRFVPSEDGQPGAVAAGCHEYINLLLSAFFFSPPRVFAGGPFSNRGGAARNDFENFLPLDDYELKAWKLRIEGSRGDKSLEFNGPVKGYQAVYREGLAQLESRAAMFGSAFKDLPGPTRDLLLRDPQDALIAELVAVAFPHTLEAMYGAPEYGGNKDLAGWTLIGFDGDTQPRGYTREQVINPDNAGPLDPTGNLLAMRAFKDLVAFSSPEVGMGIGLLAQGRMDVWQAEVNKLMPRRGGLK